MRMEIFSVICPHVIMAEMDRLNFTNCLQRLRLRGTDHNRVAELRCRDHRNGS